MAIRRMVDRLMVAMFLLVLAGYSAVSWANVARDRSKLDSVRAAATWKTWESVPPKLESLFTNHLAARDTLAAVYAAAKMTWCGTSPSPRVWVGANGFLFYNHNGDEAYMMANDPDSHLYLEYWAHELSARHLVLNDIGCKYLVVIVPNKQTVYPELMPATGRRDRPDVMDQFLNCERLNPNLRVLDLREPLRNAKNTDQIYLLTDTHWTAEGAHIAYSEIVRALSDWFPELAPLPRKRFTRIPGRIDCGDLAIMVGLEGRLGEDMIYLEPGGRPRETGEAVPMEGPRFAHVKSLAYNKDGTTLPRAVMFCDSFGEFLTPWLSNHFSRFVSVGTYSFEKALVAREKPQVVIQLMVERALEVKLDRKTLVTHELIAR